METLNNPWVIGIGGGLLSGLVVTLITRYLFSRRDNREYVQRIVTVNQEILYALRPGISEGIIPSADVVASLIKATASKYGVDHNDVYSSPELADVLVKEVMDTSFLSAKAKAEFCTQLTQLRPPPPEVEHIEPSRQETRSPSPQLAEYRRRMVTTMSGILGLMTAVMTLTLLLLGRFKGSNIEFETKKLVFLLPTGITLVIAFLATYFTWTYRTLVQKKTEHLRSKVEKEADSEDTDESN
jgi:hypothetical protein